MKQRVLTAALLIPPVLLAVFLWNSFPLLILSLVAFSIGYLELARICGLAHSIPVAGLIVSLGFGLFLPMNPWNGYDVFVLSQKTAVYCLALLAALGVYGAVQVIRGRRGYLIAEIASLWIAAPLQTLVQLKSRGGDSIGIVDIGTPVLLCLIPLWIGDTLAIFAGRAFGRHLLAPKISPKKTVEGGLANLIGCIAGAVGVAALIQQPLIVGILGGLATGFLGQAGDLLESAMKRSAGVKDSGTLLPGHGGLLDRIDSILLSAPVVALIVVTLGRS